MHRRSTLDINLGFYDNSTVLCAGGESCFIPIKYFFAFTASQLVISIYGSSSDKSEIGYDGEYEEEDLG